MGSPEAIKQVISIIRQPQKDARIAAVVVSAMSGVTDQLIEISARAAIRDATYKGLLKELKSRHAAALSKLTGRRAHKAARSELEALFADLEGVAEGVFLLRELSAGALDYIMSYGERLAAHLLCAALRERAAACEYADARALITTDDSFGGALVDFKTTNKAVKAHFRKHPRLQVVTGFIAATRDRKTTTLGRGGSDYTAAIVGAALSAKAIEIWTDVSGVMTADPRKVKDAFPVPFMSYEEAAEMSYFGAKVIHPPTMVPAREKNIPILIKNTFAPEASGTAITRTVPRHGGFAKGISSVSDIAILQIEGSGMVGTRGIAGRLFGALSRARVNVILITQASSEHSISIGVKPSDAESARHAIEEEFDLERRAKLIDPVKVEHELSIIAVVGEGMKHQHGIAARLFQSLGKNGISVVAIAQGSSEFNISAVIGKKDETKALNAVHRSFFFPELKVVNVFLVGTGLIGGTLLKQIASHEKTLRTRGFVVRLIGVADGKKMHVDEGGIPAASAHNMLARSRSPMRLEKFLHAVQSADMPDKVFVDCTASEEIAVRYAELLSKGISVVTPSKKANSGELSYWQELRKLTGGSGAAFLYETNVGAALPVISTLRDLVGTGDRIVKIEAVLSGTLSYIFNTFTGEKRFSEIVRTVRELGYSEKDPRVDLSGMDAARKILILAREAGVPLELKDVRVESFVSPKAARARSVEAFFEQLEKEDAAFEKKKRGAEKAGKRLRYIATLEKGRARIALKAVSPEHPFYDLSGSDNMFAFTTERYAKTPLVVRGPGAGAEVTAGGVFADILRTAR